MFEWFVHRPAAILLISLLLIGFAMKSTSVQTGFASDSPDKLAAIAESRATIACFTPLLLPLL
jgi:hypothetical protein